MNLVLDAIMRHSDVSRTVPWGKDLDLAFNNTPQKSPLRRLPVDYFFIEADPNITLTEAEMFPPALFAAFLVRHRGLRRKYVHDVFSIRPSEMGKCYYHEHDPSHPPCEEQEVPEKRYVSLPRER